MVARAERDGFTELARLLEAFADQVGRHQPRPAGETLTPELQRAPESITVRRRAAS
jgi:hypothetical protein